MISLQEAKSIISNNTFELQSERVHLTLAGNRVLGQDVVASFPSPQFDNSAMGYSDVDNDTLVFDIFFDVALSEISQKICGLKFLLTTDLKICIIYLHRH